MVCRGEPIAAAAGREQPDRQRRDAPPCLDQGMQIGTAASTGIPLFRTGSRLACTADGTFETSAHRGILAGHARSSLIQIEQQIVELSGEVLKLFLVLGVGGLAEFCEQQIHFLHIRLARLPADPLHLRAERP